MPISKRYNRSHWLPVLLMLSVLILGLTACEDTLMPEPQPPIPENEANEFWHTRALSRAEQLELKRKFGIGFSYDAVYGGKCDFSAIRGQVLNLAALESDGELAIDHTNSIRDSLVRARSFSEYCQATNLTGSVSGGVLVFSADYKTVASIYEYARDTVVTFNNSKIVSTKHIIIDNDNGEITDLIQEDPDRYLTPSFRYGIEKIKRAGDNTLVVDSFINIYGTHIITDVHIGANLTLNMRTRRGLFLDYQSEETVKEWKFDVLFYNESHKLSKEDELFRRQVLNNSTLELNVTGGDVSIFNSLITDPSPTNSDAVKGTIDKWVETINDDNLALVDMKVSPIWDFIPDKDVANKVKTRVIADAPTMQEIYGNRNWVNCEIPVGRPSYKNYHRWGSSFDEYTYNSPYVTNVIAANRIVATICHEWVPEITKDEAVDVIYPVYENRVSLTSGMCVYNGEVYKVGWLYDQFVVDKLKEKATDDKLYLYFGCLSPSMPEIAESTVPIHYLIGYEWPNGINVNNGSQARTGFYEVRKFLGKFYLAPNAPTNVSALPNWTYQTAADKTPKYDSYLKEDNTPFILSGVSIGKKGYENLKNRMVRDSEYLYYINKGELWYEK